MGKKVSEKSLSNFSGLTIFVNNIHTDMIPVPLSHLVGGGVGFAVGLVRARINFSRIRLAYIQLNM